ncbi:hypothetical protein [Pseudomonas panipatensis]|uniref:hypothetical protein n=1 Tax=Pseudomonas panipatensis TaxID=428992 RepID=UPI0035AF2319
MSDSQLRIPLTDTCLVCSGFRLQVAGRPSLEVDGDLLWAVEQRIWRPLAVELLARSHGVQVTPLSPDRQPAFEAQQLLAWCGEAVLVRQLAQVEDIPGALAWWQAQAGIASLPAQAWDSVSYAWGCLLRVDRACLGLAPAVFEYLLLPTDRAAVYLGHLALDWRSLRFIPR